MCIYNIFKCKHCQYDTSHVEKCSIKDEPNPYPHLVPCKAQENNHTLTGRCKECGKDFEDPVEPKAEGILACFNSLGSILGYAGPADEEEEEDKGLSAGGAELEEFLQCKPARMSEDGLPACLKVGDRRSSGARREQDIDPRLTRQLVPNFGSIDELVLGPPGATNHPSGNHPLESSPALLPRSVITEAGPASASTAQSRSAPQNPAISALRNELPRTYPPRRPLPSTFTPLPPSSLRNSFTPSSSSPGPQHPPSLLPTITLTPATPAPRASILDTLPSQRSLSPSVPGSGSGIRRHQFPPRSSSLRPTHTGRLAPSEAYNFSSRRVVMRRPVDALQEDGAGEAASEVADVQQQDANRDSKVRESVAGELGYLRDHIREK